MKAEDTLVTNFLEGENQFILLILQCGYQCCAAGV